MKRLPILRDALLRRAPQDEGKGDIIESLTLRRPPKGNLGGRLEGRGSGRN